MTCNKNRLRAFQFFVFTLLFFFGGEIYGQSDFFWEQPEVFSQEQGTFPITAYNNNFGILVWQEPVRRTGAGQEGAGDGSINIAMAVKRNGESWERIGVIGGPYLYSGTEPSILSAVIDNQDRVIIAAAATAAQTEILVSEDLGLTFSRYRVDSGTESSLAPKIAVCSDGSYLLFVTRGSEASLSVYYTHSADGRSWTEFQPFVTEPEMRLNFLPSHVSFRGREYVIFQSFTASAESVPVFQLFIKMSEDGGRSWGAARRFTDFRDTYTNSAASPDTFDNQRPHLSVQNNSLFVVWERRYRTDTPQIYSVSADEYGFPSGVAERVNSSGAYCNNPVAFDYNGETTILWFDNRRGSNNVYMARRRGFGWEEAELPRISGGEASFGRPVVDSDGLFIFWQSSSGANTRIYSLVPDISVDAPSVTAGNFSEGRRTRGDNVRLSWNIPPDSSGVNGFSWSWSQDEEVTPERTIMLYNTSGRPQTLDLTADEDGAWYFSVAAQDYAGNWSLPRRVTYFRDTTAPPAAPIMPPALDDAGYLLSNTFTLDWEPSPVSDVAGYAWELEYLNVAESFAGMDNEQFTAAAEERYSPGSAGVTRPRGTAVSASFTNQDDGVWRFSVRAVDTAGNAGPLSSLFFRTNKYVPRTYITYVDASQDQQGVMEINVRGRGFSQGGNAGHIFLDLDGNPPYDHDFFLTGGDFSVVSDREIRGLRVENLAPGLYRLGVEHPQRGIYLSSPLVSITETGTVKFGDYSNTWKPAWLLKSEKLFDFNTGTLILAAVLVLCGLGLFVSIRGIVETIAEGAAIRLDAAALITGDLMPAEKKKRLNRIKRRGAGLRLKLTAFTIALVIVVVSGVSTPLYLMMTGTQRDSLLQGLWDRSTVLLEGLASGARAYLPLRSILELGLLPAQMNSVPEARYITITGFNSDLTAYNDHVWASNDPSIESKIDTQEFSAGVSRITDPLAPVLEALSERLNTEARQQVGAVSESIDSLTREGLALALRTDAESIQRLNDIEVQRSALQTRLSERLSDIGKAIMSEPEFSLSNFTVSADNTYLLYKPVMYRQGSEDVYFRGLVRLEISVESILEEIAEGQISIIRVILLVALAAVTAGALGALLLATYIIMPIRQLVRHVEIIRDTDDKEELDGVDIKLKSRDELSILGNTINDMTHGLVKAAAAASDLSIGKEIQKKFIPLELDKDGNKLSYGSKDTKYLDFFGYYEGAKGVSGDYFDYQDLDGRYYAIIKCDVAGKGIPAALIMIQVATMFINFFRRWKPTEKGMHIEDLVYQINDFLETLGFKGRFAAFTLCLYDSQTGTVRFCNAGDNIIHLFDASEGRVKTLTLPETPATGVLPNFMVQSKGGYTVQTMKLDRGDILFLYTDGIEEAKRKFRNARFEEILCEEGETDSPHETHTVGQGDEEMGPDRVEGIINAVMNKRVYTLHKWHNPEGENKELEFDFTSCEGTLREVIMSLVSVEKMFRCYKDPRAAKNNRIMIDRNVDAFLRKYFINYRDYCSFVQENPANNAYIYYTNVMEDEQYDDLTILGIKRK